MDVHLSQEKGAGLFTFSPFQGGPDILLFFWAGYAGQKAQGKEAAAHKYSRSQWVYTLHIPYIGRREGELEAVSIPNSTICGILLAVNRSKQCGPCPRTSAPLVRWNGKERSSFNWELLFCKQ
jgi:hypothetical protein